MRFRVAKIGDFSVARDFLPRAYRYSPEMRAKLPDIWAELYRSGRLISAVVEDWPTGNKTHVVGVGLSVFVTDEFAEELLSSPRPFINAELHNMILSGNSPVLSSAQIAKANTNGGLNLLPLHFCTSCVDTSQSVVLHTLSAAQDLFWVMHAGYQVKRIIKEVVDANLCEFMKSTGMSVVTDYMSGNHADGLQGLPDNEKPYLLSVDHDDMPLGSQMSLMFIPSTARFFFTNAEKRVLLCGLLRETDDEVAKDLNLSRDTVRKHWRSIYNRIVHKDPGFFSDLSDSDKKIQTRGKGKRRLTLRYIQTHMAELRPHGE